MLRKTFAVLCTAALVALAGLALAGEHAEKAETVSVQGWITDTWCGKKNASAEGKACALACAKKGAELVLYAPSEDKTYGLDDQEQAKGQVGHEVEVTGTLDTESQKIQVEKIEAVEGSKEG
jgi:hypothetical protein